jgi:hypothetical protein
MVIFPRKKSLRFNWRPNEHSHVLFFLLSRLFSSKIITTIILKNRSPRFQNYFVSSHLELRRVLKLAVLGIMAET